jgi:hypothetical protein
LENPEVLNNEAHAVARLADLLSNISLAKDKVEASMKAQHEEHVLIWNINVIVDPEQVKHLLEFLRILQEKKLDELDSATSDLCLSIKNVIKETRKKVSE